MTDNTTEAGWYPDPHDATQQRYFDGANWSDHYAPVAGNAPAEAWDNPPTGSHDSSAGLSDVGTLMGSAWSAVTKRIGSLLALTIGGAVAAVIVFAIVFAALVTSDSGVVGVLGLIIIGLLAIAAGGAYYLIVARIFLGEHQGVSISVADAWNQIKHRILPFVGTAIGLYVAFVIGFSILFGILGSIHPVLLLLALPLLAFVATKVAFLSTAAAANNESIYQGSIGVSEGRFWPVFGRIVLLGLVSIVFGIVMQIAIAVAASASVALAVILSLVSMIGSLLTGMFVAAGLAKLYLEAGGRTNITASHGSAPSGMPNVP